MRIQIGPLLFTMMLAAPLTFAANPKLTPKGTGVIGDGSAAGEAGYEIRQGPENDAHFIKAASGSRSPARIPADAVPQPGAAAVIGPGANFTGFNGISHLDQRLAADGNQFSLEPPDQGLAVGNGYVVEAVNLAVSVYSTGGVLLAGPAALNPFFRLAPAILRDVRIRPVHQRSACIF
jgi:hypothetical protein